MLATTLAQEAGDLLLAHHRARDRLTVSTKRAGDFLSEADTQAEAHLRAALRKARPEDGWLGEETGEETGEKTGEKTGAEESTATRRWVVDPLDGTTNFLRGIGHWCVSIGLEVAGRPVLGVVHDPLRGETFAAAPGLGVTLNDAPVQPAEGADITSALFGTGFPFGTMPHIEDHAEDIRRLMPHCAGVRRMGSAALDLAYVASGRLDGFWERRLRAWDIAAGLALLSEAGAVTEALLPGEDPWTSGTILTASPAIFATFAGVLRKGAV